MLTLLPLQGRAQFTPVLTAAGRMDQSVYLRWTSIPGSANYRIYWDTSSPVTTSSSSIFISGSSTFFHLHTGLTPGTLYYYAIEALDGSNNSTGLSPEVSALVGSDAVTPVTGGSGDGFSRGSGCQLSLNGVNLSPQTVPLRSYSSQGQILLGWPVQSDLASYSLERMGIWQAQWTQVASGTLQSFLESPPAVTIDSTYRYRLTATLTNQCILNPSDTVFAVAMTEPSSFGGGSGDGHASERECNRFLDGTHQTLPAQPITIYSSENQILVSWPEEVGATSYTVERSLFQQNNWSSVTTAGAGVFSFLQTSAAVTPGQVYEYRVLPNLPATFCPITYSPVATGVAMVEPPAYPGGSGDGHSTFKACQVGLNGALLASPSQAIVSYPSQDYILLAWPSETNAALYVLERSPASQNQWTTIQSSTALFTDQQPPSIVSGTTYDYRVRVQLADLCWLNPSPVSSVVPRVEPASFGGGTGDGHGLFRACDMFLDGTPGGIPSQPFITYTSQLQTLLSWPAEVNVSGYDVQRSTNLAGPWTNLATNTANTFFSDTDPTLIGGQKYYYRVKANNLAGCPLAFSLPDSVVVYAEPASFGGGAGDGFSGFRLCSSFLNGTQQTLPGQPITVYGSESQILVAWPEEIGATSYTVERTIFQNNNWSQVFQTPNATTFLFSQTLPAVSPNVIYEYRVRPNVPATYCPITFSGPVSGVVFEEPAAYSGGSGDGHATSKACEVNLSGFGLAQSSQQPVAYPSMNGLIIAWPTETNAVTFVLERSLFNLAQWTPVQSSSALFATEQEPSIAIGVLYDYRVKVQLTDLCWMNPSPPVVTAAIAEPAAFGGGDGDGHGFFRACDMFLDGTPGGIPSQSFTSYASQGQILLSWPAEVNVSGYDVQRSLNLNGPWTNLILNTANTFFADTDPLLLGGQQYYYRVKANNLAGCPLAFSVPDSVVVRGEPSAWGGGSGDGHSVFRLCGTFLNGSQQTQTGQPIVVYSSESQVLLSWPEEIGATTYTVERSLASQNSWTQVFQTPNSTTFSFSQSVPAVVAGQQYDYRVRPNVPATYCPITFSAPEVGVAMAEPSAYPGGAGDGHSTSKACDMGLNGSLLAPASQALTSYLSQDNILLAWPTETNAALFILERSLATLNQWTQVQSSSALFGQESTPAIVSGTSYDYRVRVQLADLCWMNPSPIATVVARPEPASFGGGEGDGHGFFRACDMFLDGTPGGIPSQPFINYASQGQVLLTWPVEINVSGYDVQRSLNLNGPWTNLIVNTANTFFADTDPLLVGGQQYYYRVKANNLAGCPLAFSNPDSVVVRGEPSAWGGGGGDGHSGFRLCGTFLNGTQQTQTGQPIVVYSSESQILLTWPEETGATTYTVERSLASQNSWTQVFQTPNSTTFFFSQSVPAVVAGQQYDYRVRPNVPATYCPITFSAPEVGVAMAEPAAYPGGSGDGYATYKACDMGLNGAFLAPASQALTAYLSQDNILLSWSSETNASVYVLERSLTTQNQWTQVQSGVALFGAESVPAIVSGTTYDYRVRVQLADLCWMNPSPLATVTARPEPAFFGGGDGDGHGFFRACDMFLNGTPGGIPSQPFVIYASQSQTLLSWPAEVNVSGYDVQRSLSLSGPWTTIASNTANLFFQDTDPLLVGGQKYFYRVKANNLAGCPLAFSMPDSAVVIAEPLSYVGGAGDGHGFFRACDMFLDGTPGGIPSQPFVIYTPQAQILLSWPAEVNVSGYDVQRSLNLNGPWTNLILNTANTFFADTDPLLAAGQQYYYRVKANNLAGCPLAFSIPDSAVVRGEPAAWGGGNGDGHSGFRLCGTFLNGTQQTQTGQPIVVYSSESGILLSWPEETGASTYTVERSLAAQNSWTQVFQTPNSTTFFFSQSVPAVVAGQQYDYRVRPNVPATYCPITFSAPEVGVAIAEPSAYPGGAGDGYATYKACDMGLNGASLAVASQPLISYLSQDNILLAWSTETNASLYVLERSLATLNQWTQVQSSSALFGQESAPAIVSGTTYDYRVRVQLADLCWMNPSPLATVVARPEPASFGGGDGDGHGFFRACDMFLDGTPGGIPSQPFINYASQAQVLLTWPVEINVSGYDVQRSLNLNGPWTNLIVNTANTFFADTDPSLVGGQQYYYRVKANNLAGCPLAFSTPDSVVVRGEPSAWGGGSGDGHSGFRLCGSFLNGTQQTQTGQPIVVYSSESQILLTWPEETGASTYTVERSLASQNNWTQVFQTPNSTTFFFSQSVPAVVAGQQYDYRVRPNVPATYCPITFSAPEVGVAMAEPSAYPGGDGDGYSTFKACDMGLNGSFLAAASQPIATYLSQNNILLAWPSENNAAIYILERSPAAQNLWIQVQSSTALFGEESTPVINSGVTYDYRVRVQLADLCWMNPSPVASVVARTEPSAFGGGAGDGHGFFRACDMFLDGTPGGIPSQAFITYASQNQILLSWPAEVNVSGYDVQRGLSFNGPWSNLIVNTANTFFPDTDPLLVGGQQYFYRVKANNLAGCPLAFSVPDSVVVRAEPAAWGGGSGDGHSGFRLCNTFINGTQQTLPGQQPTVYSSEHQILVSWPEEIGASTYTVERSLSNQNTWTQVFQTPNSTTFSFNQTLPAVQAGTVYDYRVRPNVPATYCPITFSLPEAGVAIAEPAAYPGGAGDGHATFKACEYDLNGVPLAAPSQALTGYPSMEELLISWPAETNGSVYILERSLAGQNQWVQVQNGPGLFASEAPLAIQSAILYDYRVRVQLNDLCWLNPSPITSIVARPEPASFGGGAGDGHAEFRLCNTLLDGQSQFIAGAPIHIYNQQSQILVTWPSQFAAVGYTVERSDFQQNNWSQVFQTANPAVLSFLETEPALTSGTQYDYRVRPDLAATSCPLTFSPASTAVAMAEPVSFGGGDADGHATSKACQVLLNGQNLSAASQPLIPYPSMESILVAWNSEANAINYVLERSDAGLNQWQQVSSGTNLFGSDAPPQITSAIPYDYRVRVQLADLCWMNPTPLDSVVARPEPASFGGGAGDGHAVNSTCALLTLNHGTISITGTSPACTADSLLLTAATAASYQWSLNGTPITGATASTFYPQQNGTYTVVLTGLFGCTVNANGVPLTITPNPATPSGATAFPSLISCGPVALTAPTPPPGMMFYWQTQFNSQVTAVPADTVFIVSTPGYYYLNAFDSLGCWSLSSDSIQVLSVGSPTEVANVSETGTCIVPGLAGWNFFIGSDGRAIAAIQEQGDTLGSVTSFVYVTGQPSNQFDGTHEFLGRHWLISPATQPANPVTLRLYFSQAELDSFFVASQASPTPNDNASSIVDLRVIKYSGPTEDNIYDLSDANSVETLTPIGSGNDLNGLYIDVQITSFSEFWISGSGADGNGPLPITVLSNSLTCSNLGVNLQLNTATEINNLGFVIQRSSDMAAWDSIAWVPGAGTTAAGQQYNYNDSEHPRGGAFYRWLQVDTDGSLNPTQALWINCQEDNGPRIVWAGEGENGGIDVRLDWDMEENLSLGLYDMSGRLLSDVNVQIKDGVHQFQVAKNRPSSGLYVIRASGNRGDQHLRFVVTGK